ncbi:class I SAM-dependent methyltransferase [Pseudomonas putida]|uniref:class I SAM-dependent methyltransferase n=1 Tax=Pseudomonas putida TaxID=303 RepID=UPI003D98DBED
MNLEYKRLSIEMVGSQLAQSPSFISEDYLNRLGAYLRASPSVVIVDLGVHASPTSHPSFVHFARSVGSILKGRSGVLAVWCDATTECAKLEAVAESISPILAVPLPHANRLDCDALATGRNVVVFDADCPDSHSLGVPFAVRPDTSVFAQTEAIRGGCPIVEQKALFIDVDGSEFACPRQMWMADPLLAQPQDGPSNQASTARWHALRHSLRLDRRDQAMRSCADCCFSYQEWIDDAQLRSFWMSQDDSGELVDADEREHLFGKAIPTPQRIVKVDLGCGPVKRRGFTGIDRFPLPGVDIVADINKDIPLPDDSVDYLVASHSLEHFDDLPHVIHEIHRVCKDRALVTIVAPYSATGLNLANPYHTQVFNEHTARFFTNATETALERSEFDFPSAKDWGLASSDHSNWRADLRLLKCEFFYMPAYRGLDESAKRVLRQSLNDVCEQMLLQLLVVKSPISKVEFEELSRTTVFQEPPAVTARRNEERVSGAPNHFTQLMEVPDSVSKLHSDLQAARSEASLVSKRVTAVNAELIRRDQAHGKKIGELEQAVAALRKLWDERQSALGGTTAPSADHVGTPVYDPAQSQVVRAMLWREHESGPFSRRVRLFRQRAQNLAPLIAPNFEPLKQFGNCQGWIETGLRLQESELWRSGQEWIYDLPVDGGSLAGIRLALTTRFKPTVPTPLFEYAIWSADSTMTLARGQLIACGDLSLAPLMLHFAPINTVPGFVRVRLLGLPAVESLGIRTIEWRELTTLRRVRSRQLFAEPLYD